MYIDATLHQTRPQSLLFYSHNHVLRRCLDFFLAFVQYTCCLFCSWAYCSPEQPALVFSCLLKVAGAQHCTTDPGVGFLRSASSTSRAVCPAPVPAIRTKPPGAYRSPERHWLEAPSTKHSALLRRPSSCTRTTRFEHSLVLLARIILPGLSCPAPDGCVVGL
jgi:hypothetical protein